MEFVFGLENGHFQNASDQKLDTTSENQLFITRNFVLGPKRFLHSKGPKNGICLVPYHGSAKEKSIFRTFRVKEFFWAQIQSF